MAGFSDLGDKLSDWVKYGFDFENGDDTTTDDGDNGNGDDTGQDGNGDNQTQTQDSEGQLCMGVTVQFKDGTQKTVGPEDMVFTLFPMTIYFEGKEVSAIRFYCYMLVDWSGQLNSFRVDGWMQTEIPYEDRFELIQIHEVYGDDMPRNEWFSVADMTVQAEDIESLVGDGDWDIRGITYLDVQAVFPSTTDTRSANAYSDLPISVTSGGLTVFSVEIQPQVLNP